MSDLIRMTGISSGLDTESIITQLTSGYQTKIDKVVKKQKSVDLKRTVWKDLNKEIYSFYTGTLSNMRWGTSYSKMSTKSSSDALTVTAGTSAAIGVQSAQIRATAKAGYVTGAKVSDGTEQNKVEGKSLVTDKLGLAAGDYTFNNKTISIDDTTTVSGLMSKLKDAGVKASFDENQQRFYISAKDTGVANDFDLSSSATSSDLLSALKMDQQVFVDENGKYTDANGQEIAEADVPADAAVRVKGEDAQLMLNGTLYTSSSNEFSINGLSLTVNRTTDEKISVTTSKDTEGVYENIKKMFKEYNTLINKIQTKYNEKAGKYEPLTEEEASALTDKELEKWNEKLNDSALYKDERLGAVSLAMRQVLSAGVEMSDGTRMYLADFGIATQSYFSADANERYAYHIDGDADDDVSSGNKDKLKQMIAEDPEKVQEFFSGLCTNLYNKLTKEMKSSSMRSMYKVYNDKSLDKEYSSYDEVIKKLEDKMSAAEDKYYKQFSKMETMLTKINSNSSAFSSFLG